MYGMKRIFYMLVSFSVISPNDAFAHYSVDSLKILFAGNSLTYTNDLPSLVQEFGKFDSVTVVYKSLLFPDYSLEDLWNGGEVEEEIERGNYDYAVLQQGPSALPGSQQLLLEYTGRFAEVCKRNGTKLALLMVWPSKARLFDLGNVIASYTGAAKKTGSLLCPAGLAWKYAWQSAEAPPLYGTDGFHPGIDGSLLAAMTVYGRLSGKTGFDFVDFERCTWKLLIAKEKFKILTEAAAKALLE